MAKPKKREEEWTGQIRMLPGPKMVAAEKDVQGAIQMAAAAWGVMLMRNNNGLAQYGKHRVKYGLGNGSADLIGCVPPYGRFIGIECKRPKGGVISKDQEQWIAHVHLMGGVAGVATSVEEAFALVNKARRLP